MLQTNCNISMNYLFKEKLRERLEYCLGWSNDTELYLLSKNLTDIVNDRFYEKRPLLNFLLKIFYLPINTFYFFKFLRISRDLEKNAIEIDYIYSQLENKMENNEKE